MHNTQGFPPDPTIRIIRSRSSQRFLVLFDDHLSLSGALPKRSADAVKLKSQTPVECIYEGFVWCHRESN